MSLFFEFAASYPTLLQFIGVIGFILYVGGFFLVQNGTVCGNGVLYPLSKVIAAVFVLMSLIGAFNLASFLIQVSYIGIGVYGVAMRFRDQRKRRIRSDLHWPVAQSPLQSPLPLTTAPTGIAAE